MTKKINKVSIILEGSKEKKNKLHHTTRSFQLKERRESKRALKSFIKNDTLIEQKKNLKRNLFYHLKIKMVSFLLTFIFTSHFIYFNKLVLLDWFPFFFGVISFVCFLNSLGFFTKNLIEFLKIDKKIRTEKNHLLVFFKKKDIRINKLIDDLRQEDNIRPYRRNSKKIYSLNIEKEPSASIKHSNPIEKKRSPSNESLKKLKNQFNYHNNKKTNNKIVPWR